MKLNKNVIKKLIIKNGAKGISVFIPSFFPFIKRIEIFDKNIKIRLTIVPIQKDNIIENIPCDKPSAHPIPKTSLPSPRPMRRPFEKYHINTNGIASIGPARKAQIFGNANNESNINGFINKDKNEMKINK